MFSGTLEKENLKVYFYNLGIDGSVYLLHSGFLTQPAFPFPSLHLYKYSKYSYRENKIKKGMWIIEWFPDLNIYSYSSMWGGGG